MKNSIKKLIIKTNSILNKNMCSKIIFYHDVYKKDKYTPMATDIEIFKQHIEVIKEENFTIKQKILNKNKEIEIHFDDGFRGIYENFDFFIENNIPIKVFLITDRIGKKNYLNISEIKELLSTNLFFIGSHTKSHKNLTDLTEKEVNSELEISKKFLEDKFGLKIEDLCFPRGKFTEVILKKSQKLYKNIYSSITSCYEDKIYGAYGRFLVQFSEKDEFKAIINGGNLFLKNLYKRKHIER